MKAVTFIKMFLLKTNAKILVGSTLTPMNSKYSGIINKQDKEISLNILVSIKKVNEQDVNWND